jgi:hypothetical protein
VPLLLHTEKVLAVNSLTEVMNKLSEMRLGVKAETQ